MNIKFLFYIIASKLIFFNKYQIEKMMAVSYREDISHVLQVKIIGHTEDSSINFKGRNNRRNGRRWEHNIKIEQTFNKCTLVAQKMEQTQSSVTMAVKLVISFLLSVPVTARSKA
jgi:hypothetical protein